MRTITICLLLTGTCILASCKNEKDDVTNTVNKAGSVETAVTIQHADSTHDVLLTTHKIWVNFQEYKTVIHADTIPSLGTVSTTAENADGDKKTVDVKKDYEIFITVK